MTINGVTTYNYNKAYTDKEYAKTCWQNYRFENNSLNIPVKDIESLENRWSQFIPQWKRDGFTTTNDSNEYEIDDRDFSSLNFDIRENDSYKAQYEASTQRYQTKSQMQEKIKKIEDSAKNNNSSAIVQNKISSNAVSTSNMTMSAASAATTGATIIAAACGSAIGTVTLPITCSLNLAVAILYYATRPNKQQVEALRILKEEMLKAQENLKTEAERAEAFEANAIRLQEEVATEEERINEEIKLTNDELVVLGQCYNELLARQESGEELSKSDHDKMQSIYTILGEYAETLDNKVLASKGIIADKTAKVSEQRDGLIDSITTLADTQALTDIATSFDTETQKAADLEFAAQTTNAVTGYINGALATTCGIFMWWLLPFAAMAFTGAGMSTAAAVEQNKFRKELSEDIDIRIATQAQNTVVTNFINTSIQNHNNSIDKISNPEYTEIVIPEVDSPPSQKEDRSTEPSNTTDTNNPNTAPESNNNSELEIDINSYTHKNNPFYKKEE